MAVKGIELGFEHAELNGVLPGPSWPVGCPTMAGPTVAVNELGIEFGCKYAEPGCCDRSCHNNSGFTLSITASTRFHCLLNDPIRFLNRSVMQTVAPRHFETLYILILSVPHLGIYLSTGL